MKLFEITTKLQQFDTNNKLADNESLTALRKFVIKLQSESSSDRDLTQDEFLAFLNILFQAEVETMKNCRGYFEIFSPLRDKKTSYFSQYFPELTGDYQAANCLFETFRILFFANMYENKNIEKILIMVAETKPAFTYPLLFSISALHYKKMLNSNLEKVIHFTKITNKSLNNAIDNLQFYNYLSDDNLNFLLSAPNLFPYIDHCLGRVKELKIQLTTKMLADIFKYAKTLCEAESKAHWSGLGWGEDYYLTLFCNPKYAVEIIETIINLKKIDRYNSDVFFKILQQDNNFLGVAAALRCLDGLQKLNAEKFTLLDQLLEDPASLYSMAHILDTPTTKEEQKHIIAMLNEINNSFCHMLLGKIYAGELFEANYLDFGKAQEYFSQISSDDLWSIPAYETLLRMEYDPETPEIKAFRIEMAWKLYKKNNQLGTKFMESLSIYGKSKRDLIECHNQNPFAQYVFDTQYGLALK